MALVWFVDKFPRSRKPVLYRRLEDFVGSPSDLSQGNDLLPVLLPCALCCAQQQMSASLVAHQLHQQKSKSLRRSRSGEKATQSQRSRSLPQNFDHHQLGHYNEFLQLCQHVECMVEKSMQRLTQEGKNDDDGGGVTSVAKDTKKLVDDDDMMLRSLRDANRSPAPLMKQMVHQQTNKNHYVWKEAEDRPPTKYKSQFFPMRNHDLVRDDLAVRRLIKPTGLSSTPALDRRPPPHPNHKSSSQQRPPRPKVARLKQ